MEGQPPLGFWRDRVRNPLTKSPERAIIAFMNQDDVKEILLGLDGGGDLPDGKQAGDFSVVFSGKRSARVNGLYKPYTREIILHNKNFENDNQLVYTAIHEYAHHLLCEEAGGELGARHHTQAFWARFHGLLKKAEEAGVYAIGVDSSPELSQLTAEIREKCLAQNGRIMGELGRLLSKARGLCERAGVRYEDYIDRVLCIPRGTARDAEKVASLGIDESLGFDAMKIVAAQRSAEGRAEAGRLLAEGESPSFVKGELAARKKEEESPRERLEKEKARLEKSVARMTARIEHIEQALASMG